MHNNDYYFYTITALLNLKKDSTIIKKITMNLLIIPCNTRFCKGFSVVVEVLIESTEILVLVGTEPKE